MNAKVVTIAKWSVLLLCWLLFSPLFYWLAGKWGMVSKARRIWLSIFSPNVVILICLLFMLIVLFVAYMAMLYNSRDMVKIYEDSERLERITGVAFPEFKLMEYEKGEASFLGDYEDKFILEMEEELPDIQMDYDLVMSKSLENSSFSLNNELSLLNAESAVARAKASRGFSFSLNARFGMSQTGPEFPQAYKDLLDQEVVGVTFSIPIFDWGLGKGKVQKAKAAQEVVKAQVQQSENDYRRQVFTAVSQFNNQRQQCMVSRRAMNIAKERYELTMHRFREGNATVTDLNMAQTENDSAFRQYISDVSNFWAFYYQLRQCTLYDFIKGEDLEIDVNEMI